MGATLCRRIYPDGKIINLLPSGSSERRLFLQPAFFEKGIAPLFTAATRRYPLYFHFPWSEEDTVTISLPKGYVLDNADAPAPISAGAISHYAVKIQVTKDQSSLTYHRSFFFGGDDRIFIAVQSYGAVKQLFEAFNRADNHSLALKPGGAN